MGNLEKKRKGMPVLTLKEEGKKDMMLDLELIRRL